MWGLIMKNIKIGACDWGLPGAGLYAMKIAAEFGIEALSLRIGLFENNYPLAEPVIQKYYLEDQQRYGIDICAIALNDYDNLPMHARKGTRHYDLVWTILHKAVATAKALGVKVVQVPAFGESEMKTQADMEQSALCFQYLCDKLGPLGIQVASESLLRPEEFARLHQLVDRPNFGAYYDSQNYHLFRGYDQLEILQGLYPYMVNQLHVKDGSGAMSGGLLGSGDSNFLGSMKMLTDKGFEGYILTENYYDQLPLRLEADDPYDLLREDLKVLRETVQSL